MRMTVRVSTVFQCTEAEFWQKWTDPASWQYIVTPFLSAAPVEPVPEGEWQIDRTYTFNLRLFTIIPIGRHSIRLLKIDRETNTISSDEGGLFAPIWIHHIWFRAVPGGRLAYTDEVEIDAGWRTPLVWFLANMFYRHRHRRWRALLRQTSQKVEARA